MMRHRTTGAIALTIVLAILLAGCTAREGTSEPSSGQPVIYKGEAGPYLDVKAFGGTVDGERMVFTDFDYAPREGERVVVLVQQIFTEANGDKLATPRSLYTVNGTQLTNQFGGDKSTITISDVVRAAK